MSGIKTLRKIQWGKEVTPGTTVPATAVYRGTGTLQDARKMGFPSEDIGIIMPSDAEYYTQQYLSEINLGPDDASFEQLPYLFEAGIKKVGTPTADGGGSGKIYSYPLSLTSQNALQYLSLEGGDDNQAEFGPYHFVKEITLDGKWGEPLKVSAKTVGRTLDRGGFNAGTAISFDNAHHIIDSGTGFSVANGFATTMIVKVTGTVNNNGIYTVTARADGQLTVTENTATEAGGNASAMVQQWYTGGPAGLALPTVERMMFTKAKIFLDPAGGSMGGTPISNIVKSMKCTIKTGVGEFGAGNGDLNFGFAMITAPEVTVDVDFWANATMVIEKQNWRNQLARLMRIQVLGSTLTTAGTYTYKTLNINLPGKWTKFSTLQEQNGGDYVSAAFSGRYNPTVAVGPSFDVVNQLASLP
jgi:hypothetical protein